MSELSGIVLYFLVLSAFILFKKKKVMTQQDFVLGNRSLSPLTTALAANASDMSNWLFMGYPGMVFLKGGAHIWVAIGLVTMMWLNWSFVAPRVRRLTEKTGSNTLTDFFEKRIGQNWPGGRLATSCILFFFYTIYVSGGVSGMGLLLNSLFGLQYEIGVVIGIGLICGYLLVGGYFTLAQVDLFQGLFLLFVILFVPIFLLTYLGGFQGVFAGIRGAGKSVALITQGSSITASLLPMLGWGLGYFGQPHIITKFMGIRDVSEINISKWIGISWQAISLIGATLVGLVGIAFFHEGLSNHEEVFLAMVRKAFPAFVSGIFLCGVIAAILNASSSMLLVLSTTLTEDIYKRFIDKDASPDKLLKLSRITCIATALFASGIALFRFASIDRLVLFAWSGLGASLGPLLIMSLFAKKITGNAAWLGMISGALVVVLWPLTNFETTLSLVVAFPAALSVIYLLSKKEEALSEGL